MLVISRKKDQKIIVADDIEITILEVGRNRVRFGIKAPKNVPIHTRLKDTPPVEQAVQQVVEQIADMKLEDAEVFLESLHAAARSKCTS